MTPKAKYYETLANTMIKNFEKRRMEASPADTNRPNGWGSVRDVRNGIHL